MASVNHLAIPNRIIVVRDYAELWQQYFSFFSDELQERSITQEEESEFARIMSLLALNHYKFAELTRGYFREADKVLEVLEETASLDHLKNMPDASFGKIQVEWHTLFIGMHKTLGKLLSEMTPKQLALLQQQAEPPAAQG